MTSRFIRRRPRPPAFRGEEETGLAGDRPHALYRFYSATGDLLYVGVTIAPERRFREHRGRGWWQEVSGISIERYPSRGAVLGAERRAIAIENPRHNLARHPLATRTKVRSQDDDVQDAPRDDVQDVPRTARRVRRYDVDDPDALLDEYRRIVRRPMTVTELWAALPEDLRGGSPTALSRYRLPKIGVRPAHTNKGSLVRPMGDRKGVKGA